jgi:hypothetical protein
MSIKPPRLAQKLFAKVKQLAAAQRYRTITANYDIRGYRRIYLVHIRKTGGTSLIHMFLNLAGTDSSSLYQQLLAATDHRILADGKVYVGWHVPYINRGNYFLAFSHSPLHQLNLPAKTFTIACFRDPVQRVLSHYNMLKNYQTNGIEHPCMQTEGKWLGDSFTDFLERMPQAHLCNQLYMFSAQYDIDEAIVRVAELSHYFFAEDFNHGVDVLNQKLGFDLTAVHVRKASYKAEIPPDQIDRLREMLTPEYEFLAQVRALGQ